MTLKVVVADDDVPVCNLLKSYLCSYDGVEVVGTALNGEIMVETVMETSPDAVFADIQMPGVDGLSAVYYLQKELPSLFIVFVSAHSHYAVEAFNMDAIDFLSKPFTRERVGRSLDKLKRFKLARNTSPDSSDGQQQSPNGHIMLKSGHGIIVLEKKSIIFVEKLGKKCIFHTIRGKYETVSSLSAVEEYLTRPDFFRCHKGFIINITRVERIFPYKDRSYEISFYNYQHKAPMRRDKFEEYCSIIKC